MNIMDNLSLITKNGYYDEYYPFNNYSHKMYNILQLKDESILIYTNTEIFILDKKLKHYSMSLLDKANENKNRNERYITNIKQLKNGTFLCCNKNLYIFSIKNKKIYNSKELITPKDEIILDVIELKNGKILGITNKSILEIKNKEDNYEFSHLFNFPDNYITNIELKNNDNNFYINVNELPNNKLLIHSLYITKSYGICGTHPPSEFISNQIFILNANTFEIIYNFEEFNSCYCEINIIILKKYICISIFNYYNFYNIDDYKLIKKIKDKFNNKYIIKYDENKFISISEDEEENDIIIYYISDIDNIYYKIFKCNFIKFDINKYNGIYPVRHSKNKSFYLLKNKTIFIICHGLSYIVEFPIKKIFD